LIKKHGVLRNPDNEDFKEHDFVKDMIPDPSKILDSENLDLVQLHGYLGKSSNTEYRRLYFDKSLTDFCEIREKDIVKHESVRTNTEEYTVVWLKPGTRILHTKVETAREIESGFLQGDIVGKYLSPAKLDQFVTSFVAGGGGRGRGLVQNPSTVICEIITVTIGITVEISRMLCTGSLLCGDPESQTARRGL
jgi:hypothetical protein